MCAVAAPFCQLHPEVTVDKQFTLHTVDEVQSQHIQDGALHSTVTANPSATV